jgi:hypothetical protein
METKKEKKDGRGEGIYFVWNLAFWQGITLVYIKKN